MPSYKLSYFSGRGRAEVARMMFHLEGQEFVDERFTNEEWAKIKTDKTRFPLGQAPVLLVDDWAMPQSKAICGYLAREFGFYGENNLEAAQIDVVIETYGDMESKMMPIFTEKDQTKRAELVKTFNETTGKPFISFLAELIKKAGGKYYVGNKLSVADLTIFNVLDILTVGKYKMEGIVDNYPDLIAFIKFIREESPLKSYLESRQLTDG